MMKLSTAIRKGSKKYPETRTDFYDPSGACCALGAACLGAEGEKTKTINMNAYLRASALWIKLTSIIVRCPVKRCPMPRQLDLHLIGIVNHVHIFHSWSRERIAGWVAKVEMGAKK